MDHEGAKPADAAAEETGVEARAQGEAFAEVQGNPQYIHNLFSEHCKR